MLSNKTELTSSQLVFRELFLSTLIYITTLGLFNDYTSLVEVKSFSSTIYASFVLAILTFLVFFLKGKIYNSLKDKQGTKNRVVMVFSIWLVMFLSKFVFLYAIDIIFEDQVNIEGFIAILLLAVIVTVVQRVADLVFVKLGE